MNINTEDLEKLLIGSTSIFKISSIIAVVINGNKSFLMKKPIPLVF